MIKKIRIGTGSCGLAAGAGDVLDILKSDFPNVLVEEVGCLGHCYAEPLLEVVTETESIYYGEVPAKKEFIEKIVNADRTVAMNFRKSRTDLECLRVTALVGKMDPCDMDAYIANGGYEALKKALASEPSDVVDEVKKSGLRGRGGGGFSTGLKWSFLAAKKADRKIVVCNADEGDPGAFMDRSLMESVPHQVLEGMLICAWATGATEIIIYCRAEYPMAIKHLEIAISDIEKSGLNKFVDRTIAIRIKEGAGAFVCGEETALINSLEGKRGTPRFRPPFPTDS
ncbi:MAG: NADH-quinone oxidoreductase subunit F, partial [Lentisphaeria bacterium]